VPVTSVVVVTARMGAGHEGAARELARRVRARGHRAVVVDLLDAFPGPLAWAWRAGYGAQLRWWPESYERSYGLYRSPSRLWPWSLWAVRRLAQRHLVDRLRAEEADVVVSTYALATLVLGELRAAGVVTVPLANYLTDLGVHPRTVHPACDLTIALHPLAAADAARLVDGVAGPIIVSGPVVAPAFTTDAHSPAEARRRLGLPADGRVVLVVAGSWGVGDGIEATVAALATEPAVHVVTACGRDERLRARLAARRLGWAIGWTERMPELLAAADVVVENAGGLTSLEAFAVGTPVISHRPIPGHGRDNVRALAAAGLTTATNDTADLLAAVRALTAPGPARAAQLAAARSLFAGDPAEPVLALATAARRSRQRASSATAPTATSSVAMPATTSSA
jgi:UDP-N-acetylglucosamine:LPS N-acetylglucosamine transferase